MTLFFIQGRVDLKAYLTFCKTNNLECKKAIFLFPGNSGHHRPGTTLFSIKDGAGLAGASGAIGRAGYPTLSLPTTSMEEWATDKDQQNIVQRAILDLYQALGAGYSLILPVRQHLNKDYFDQGLGEKETLEPNFWGGVQNAPNKKLAYHYIAELNALGKFAALSEEERLKKATSEPENLNYQAFVNAQQLISDDYWLKDPSLKPVDKGVSHDNKKLLPNRVEQEPLEPKKAVAQKTQVLNSPISVDYNHRQIIDAAPATYRALYGNQDPLKGARELLNDYTKSNSAWSLFFHGHWNRHYVKQVHEIVQKIDNGVIRNVDELMKDLNDIELANPQGSLARRKQFIEASYALSKTEPAENSMKFS